jgi:phospholipid-binding lipoprotein MlaA
VLPIFGPSNPRDAIGKLFVDSYFDPLGQWLDNTDQDTITYTLTGANALDEYAGIVDELDQVKKTSVDYYAAVRSLYRQKRKAEIRNGSELELPPIPDLSYDVMPEDFNQPLADVNQPSAQ